MRPDRIWWKAKGEEREIVAPDKANLVSSLLDSGLHSPVLDIDFAAELVPSTTPDHFHLYLDGLELTWDEYEELLKALEKARVIQPGFAQLQIKRKATFVRPLGVMKADGDGLNDSDGGPDMVRIKNNEGLEDIFI